MSSFQPQLVPGLPSRLRCPVAQHGAWRSSGGAGGPGRCVTESAGPRPLWPHAGAVLRWGRAMAVNSWGVQTALPPRPVWNYIIFAERPRESTHANSSSQGSRNDALDHVQLNCISAFTYDSHFHVTSPWEAAGTLCGHLKEMCGRGGEGWRPGSPPKRKLPALWVLATGERNVGFGSRGACVPEL